MTNIDINFDYRLDSKSGDPDIDSIKLYHAHKILWNKELSNGELLEISVTNKGRQFYLKNNFCFNFSSDRMCPHFVGSYKNKFENWISKEKEEELEYYVRTLGGHTIFPAQTINKKHTINQARGINSKIKDRFDLTLECIRRYYKNEDSPLFEALNRYSGFLKLFVDFNGFINFFLLHDFVDNGNVKFVLPFDDFKRDPLPQDANEYNDYANKTIELIRLRNNRIKKYLNNE